jgi:hypothetical protein
VEAAIWGMPLVNFDAMRQAYFRDAGAKYNDVMYWSKPSDWKNPDSIGFSGRRMGFLVESSSILDFLGMHYA